MAPAIRDKERTAILSSLGAGVVPSIGLQHLQVGRKGEVNALLDDLKRVEQGAASVRFVVGRFGSGKSFFLNVIQTVALEKKFVVARADITTDRRLTGSGGVARALYTEITKNIATRAKPEGGALGNLVERWVSEIAHEVTSGGGTEKDVQSRIVSQLQPLLELVGGYDFANVLSAYYRGFAENKPELQNAAVRWLRGEYSSKTEAKNDLGVRTIVDDDSIYEQLKLLAVFVRIAGYRGFVLCLDELVVLSHRLNNRVSRDRNYEAILRIVNDCLQGSVSGLAVLFAATDDCMMDKRRGLFSYDALATRLAANRFATGEVVDLSGPVIKLANLTPEDCYVLLLNIRRVFTSGVDEDALLPVAGIEAYLSSCHNRMGAAYFQTPRETVKDFVGLLSVLKQNPGSDWKTLVSGISTKAATPPDLGPPDDEVEASTQAASARAVTSPRPAAQDDDLASFKL